MVERSQRGKGKRELLGSHQKCWIWGKHAILETLRCGKWVPLEMHLSDRLSTDQAHETGRLAESLKVPVTIEAADRLKQLCKSSEHQGYLAKMPPYPYDDANELLSTQRDQPFYAILDSIQDPYNFGAILRSAEVMGVDAVFIPEKNQVEVTSLVARTSVGAVNHVAVARVPNLCELVGKLQHMKVSVMAAHEKAKTNLYDCNFEKPTAVIIGNEGSGIHSQLLKLCDQHVRIPQFGHVGSLNAAVSAGIMFYEIRRQRTS